MDSITIRWHPATYHQFSECDDCYVYAVSFKNELRYIGMAYSQSAQARLQHRRIFGLNTNLGWRT